MTRPAESHLSLDDIDALLAGAAPAAATEHAEQCTACRAELESDRELIAELGALQHALPSPGFADHVMARVALPDPFALHSFGTARRRILSSRRSLSAAAGIVLVLTAALAASIIWTLGNRETLAGAGAWLGSEAVGWLWLGLRGAASNLIEQPWYGGARDLLGTPIRIAAVSAALSLTYLGGLLALRKLMALPAGASHAHA